MRFASSGCGRPSAQVHSAPSWRGDWHNRGQVHSDAHSRAHRRERCGPPYSTPFDFDWLLKLRPTAPQAFGTGRLSLWASTL